MLKRVRTEQRDNLVGARQSQMRAGVGRKPRDVVAEQLDPARVRPQVATDLVEQRGLAGPVGTNDQTALAGADGECDVLRDSQAAESLVQTCDFKRGSPKTHDGRPRNRSANVSKPGTIPLGITRTMNRNTRPSSMFQRSIKAEA